MTVEVKPNQNTPRVKMCTVVVTSSGENLPCPKCMNTGQLNNYAQSNTYDIQDSFKWTIDHVKNYNIRLIAESENANKMTLVSFISLYLIISGRFQK